MSFSLEDVGLAMLTITVLLPLAWHFFLCGVPIELIVFGLLVAGYKGSQWLSKVWRVGLGLLAPKLEKAGVEPEGCSPGGLASAEAASPGASGTGRQRAATDSLSTAMGARSSGSSPPGGLEGRSGLWPWARRRRGASEAGGEERPEDVQGQGQGQGQGQAGGLREGGAGGGGNGGRRGPRDDPGATARGSLGPGAGPGREREARSGLSALKRNTQTPQLQWRGLINKFTPEKFDKLCEQLLATLPTAKEASGSPVSTSEFKKVLEDLLTLIFEACSRQHQYTEMYTDLTEKMLSFVSKQRPELDGQACVWEKCQHIFLTMVLKAPEISTDLPEDEYMDRKAKTKEKMVGMVKLGGDLVSRGLVPCEGVMQWIHQLLSEKTQEVYCSVDGPRPLEEPGAVQEKDMEQREVQLEVLCAILASMGSSLSDRNTWSHENRLVIEDVFMQLEQLSMDTAHLSLRIRCLIRDILDLRMAHWKEKEGKLKPGMLHPRKKDSDDEQGDQRDEAPHEVRQWLDPQLLSSLQAVKHHLEVYEDKDAKFTRLTSLIKVYYIMKEKQIVIVANSSNVKQVLDLIAESFHDLECKSLDFSTPETVRKKCIKSFELAETNVLVMASEVSTRRDFDFGKPSPVLVNFDFPMTLQLYLYRIFKRADSNTHVYTFFSPHSDVRHTSALMAALEGAKQQVPTALQKLRDQVRTEGGGKSGNRRTPKACDRGEADEDAAQRGDRGERGPPWKEKRAPGEASRDDRPSERHGHTDEARSREEAQESSKGFWSGKSRATAPSWRDGRREEGREDAKADEPQLRRREVAKKSDVGPGPEHHDLDAWQKLRVPNNANNNGRHVGARGRDRDRDKDRDRDTAAAAEDRTPAASPQTDSLAPRSERPPWFDPGILDGSEPRKQIRILQQRSGDAASSPKGTELERRDCSQAPAQAQAQLRPPVSGAATASPSSGGAPRQRRHEGASATLPNRRTPGIA